MSDRTAAGRTRFLLTMDDDLVAWLDQEGKARERSRAWVIREAVQAWKRRVERARQKQADKAQALMGLVKPTKPA